MRIRKVKYEKVKIGNFIYLDVEGTEIIKKHFGLVSKEVSKKSLYEVIHKQKESPRSIRITTKKVEDNSLREILVCSYWQASTVKKT